MAGGPDTQAGSRLEVSHLEKSYGSRKVVKDVSLVAAGAGLLRRLVAGVCPYGDI